MFTKSYILSGIALSSLLMLFPVGAAPVSKVVPVKITSVKSSDVYRQNVAANAADGIISDRSRWIGQKKAGELWLEFGWNKRQEIAGIHIFSGYGDADAISDFYIEFKNQEGKWEQIPSAAVTGNYSAALRLEFDSNVKVDTDVLRLVVTKTKGNLARIKEVIVWPEAAGKVPEIKRGEPEPKIPPIYLNQSGFNLNKPKRFTVPGGSDGAIFEIVNMRTGQSEYQGKIHQNIGDFSDFNPDSRDEFTVRIADQSSYPFRIGHWWLERVTYHNAVLFMAQSRHYLGTHKGKCKGSYGWRDDHHFGWELNTLVPQLLSNPSAYRRMPQTISYQNKEGFNGKLEPFNEAAPDIVKLIHFGADVIVSSGLDHAFFKEQLAYFLYAWPVLKEWLPQQNYTVVHDYAFSIWGKKDSEHHRYGENHNLFEVKTRVGTTKGEYPPGHSIQPNLMMYEVAKREARADAEKYFRAAYEQTLWIIEKLDWRDPLTTKGQRVSEHLTMTGLGMFLKAYPDRAPKGLLEKIEEWKKVVISRSGNMWDFRKLSDNQWCPTGPARTMWNEPGNLLGFPACALAAMIATPASPYNKRLYEISIAQMDNAFGRNPTGRCFSYDAPREIEGCDLGWFSYYRGGIGQLGDVRFVFDGAPKNEHYPYNPQIGNIGWTEGWIQFNTAFNASLAYMACYDTQLVARRNEDKIEIRLKTPLNFDYDKIETAIVEVKAGGKTTRVELHEESENSAYFSGQMTALAAETTISYGFGYFGTEVVVPAE